MHLRTVNSGRLLAVFLGVLCTIGTMAQRPDTAFWVPNGPVETLLLHDTTVIIGGAFDQVSPVTGSFVRLDTLTALVDPTLFKVNGTVHTMCSDAFGRIYVGGNFSRVGNQFCGNIFRITANGTFDNTFNHLVNGPVYTLCALNSELFIGGDFGLIDGESRNNLGAIDLSTDSVIYAFDPNVNGPVYSMHPDILYGYMIIGGDFSQVASFSPPYLAKVSLLNGLPMTFNAVPWTAVPNLNGPVFDIAVNGSEVYVAGEFVSFGSTVRPGLGVLRLYNGTLKPKNADLDGSVYTMEIIGDKVFIGGNFGYSGNQPRNHLACIDTAFTLQAWSPQTNGDIRVITLMDSTRLFVGGDFTLVDGDTMVRGALINYLDTGTVSPWNPEINHAVYAALSDTNQLYVGGAFFGLGGERRTNLCALSVNSGTVTAWNPKVNSAVHTMTLDGDSLYFAGDFTSVNGNARGRIAVIDLGTSSLLPFNPGVNGWVRTMAITDSFMYVGGNFTTLGGQPRANIGKVDKFTGLTTPWNPGCAGTVNSILPASNWIYVAGFYSTIAGFGRENLARLHPVSGIADWNWICDTDDGIYHAEFYNGKLALGGWFSTVNGQTAHDFAFVDTVSLQVTSTTFNCDGFIRTFTTYGDDFFLSGVYDVVNNQYHPRLVAYDEGNAVVDSWAPMPNAAPLAMQATASRIFLGGAMSSVAGAFHPYLQVLEVQWITPVEEQDPISSTLEIYPVPAGDHITIITEPGATQYTITDVSGKTVQAGALCLQNGRTEISVGELAGGLYILTVNGADVSLSQRIIVE